jgi:hypothetical protein
MSNTGQPLKHGGRAVGCARMDEGVSGHAFVESGANFAYRCM